MLFTAMRKRYPLRKSMLKHTTHRGRILQRTTTAAAPRRQKDKTTRILNFRKRFTSAIIGQLLLIIAPRRSSLPVFCSCSSSDFKTFAPIPSRSRAFDLDRSLRQKPRGVSIQTPRPQAEFRCAKSHHTILGKGLPDGTSFLGMEISLKSPSLPGISG